MSWAPFVYCRLLHGDWWWRAVPPQDRPHRYAALVSATLGAGSNIRDAPPRYTQAVLDGTRVIAAGFRVSEVREDLGYDNGGRPLSAVVGWVSDDPAAPAPPLDLLEQHLAEWAGAELDRWVRDVWTAVGLAVQQPRDSRFGPPPWPAVVPHDGTDLWRDTDHVRVFPWAERAPLWSAASGTTTPFTAVVGLSTVEQVDLATATHACLRTAVDRFDLPVPPPAELLPVAAPVHADSTADVTDESADVTNESRFQKAWRETKSRWPCSRSSRPPAVVPSHPDDQAPLNPELFRTRPTGNPPGDGSLI
ncbi:hypothetical protein ACFO1B_15700 [Dactylosporangium siamense]|uniref:Uncharacterized protein n=1 Tax=Dactylosporangium siamense TaxID=685454 RepID=A0A919PJV0_9ACTN|nr:hypothetical protein [Dactylosporangium siamense]GIG45284.1 hypothetical protein Dsi01nite_033250 [Dactylosporangium siamense]